MVNPVVLDDRWFLQSMDVQLWKGGLTVKKVKVNFCLCSGSAPPTLHCLRELALYFKIVSFITILKLCLIYS